MKFSIDKDFLEPLEDLWLDLSKWKRRIFRSILCNIMSFFIFVVPLALFIPFISSFGIFITQFCIGFVVLYCTSLLLTAVARSRREQAILNAKLNELSLRDSLTGLYNNRKFMIDKLTEFSENAKDFDKSVVILFADLDELKKINDEISHLAGDSAIVATARRIESVMRFSDYVFRFGGDEFIILTLVDNSINDDIETEVTKITERIENAVSAKPLRYGDEKILLAISIGAHILNPENTHERELQIVDKKMYDIKKNKKR